MAWNGRVFIKEIEAVRRPAVGCIVWLDARVLRSADEEHVKAYGGAEQTDNENK